MWTEPIRLRHVDRHKLDARLHEIRDEGNVAGEAVQFRDHKRSAMLTAELEGGSEGRPIIALAALNLQNFLDKCPVSSIEEAGDGCALCFESEAARSLPCR
jgi:hypothetical protein